MARWMRSASQVGQRLIEQQNGLEIVERGFDQHAWRDPFFKLLVAARLGAQVVQHEAAYAHAIGDIAAGRAGPVDGQRRVVVGRLIVDRRAGPLLAGPARAVLAPLVLGVAVK